MIDTLSTAHFGLLNLSASPGVATFFAHRGFVSASGGGEITFEHVHVELLSNETVEITSLAFSHVHLVSLNGEEVEL